ncbi:hypothetical protein LXL04_000477 [Taraxacum kok-saghyz]
MRTHQEQLHDQEILLPMDSQENPNLETAQNHPHVMVSMVSEKSSDLETTHNHHVVVPMGSQKNPNLETTCNHVPPSSPSSSSQDFRRSHHQHMSHALKKTNVDDQVLKKSYVSCSSSAAGGDVATPPEERVAVVEEMESGRERLKRHRVEMAGRVWIPDIWGHEDVLKDWIDCTVFDSSLGNNTIMSARAALVQEGRSTLRIENSC